MQNALILQKKKKKNHLCCHSFSKIQLNFVVLFHVLFKNIVYLSLWEVKEASVALSKQSASSMYWKITTFPAG